MEVILEAITWLIPDRIKRWSVAIAVTGAAILAAAIGWLLGVGAL